MKRVFLSIALLAFVCPLAAQKPALKPGVERRPIKTSLVATATKAKTSSWQICWRYPTRPAARRTTCGTKMRGFLESRAVSARKAT
jgi:hypothetical protein